MKTLFVIALCGCGRVAFDARNDGGSGGTNDSGGGGDTLLTDAGLPSGLVAWFPFTAPSTYTDVIAGHDGTCLAAKCPSGTAGHTDDAAFFDGTDDCLTVIDDGTFEPAQITIAVWARQDSTGMQSHVSKRTVGGSVNAWQLETDPLGGDPNALSFTTYDGSGMNAYAISPLDAIVIGQWQHLAATFDGSTKRVYIDGVQATFVTGQPALIYDGMPVKIGCDDNQPDSRYFHGALDELQFFNRALTAAEIADLAAR